MKNPLAKLLAHVYQARNLPWGRRVLAGAWPVPVNPLALAAGCDELQGQVNGDR
jgi:hypothetical protein